MGMREQVMGGRNWIQKVVEWVPGFRGYYAREHRRDADKLVREAASARLSGAVEALGLLTVTLAKTGSLDEVDRLGRLSQRLGSAADRLRLSPRGYAGFFDAVKVREGEIDRLYAQDLALLQGAEILLASAKAGALDPLETGLAQLESEIDRRKETFLDLKGG
jgi:hypothetical protein